VVSSSLTLADTDPKTLWIAKSADVIRVVLLLAGQHCRSDLNARESAYTSSEHCVRATAHQPLTEWPSSIVWRIEWSRFQMLSASAWPPLRTKLRLWRRDCNHLPGDASRPREGQAEA
jgi:hypothetical protein